MGMSHAVSLGRSYDNLGVAKAAADSSTHYYVLWSTANNRHHVSASLNAEPSNNDLLGSTAMYGEDSEVHLMLFSHAWRRSMPSLYISREDGTAWSFAIHANS